MTDAVSPFAQWFELRDELAPYIGDRAVALLAFSAFDEADGFEGAAYYREEIASSGDDVENLQVTEAERLMIEWARAVIRDSGVIEPELRAQFERAFQPTVRTLLTRFVALTVATALAETAS